ncbi:MAG: NAD(P)-dependent oxidoreductase [Planctomycetota bacterium]|nr:NAD(P)-dependent oxidoreductase [Planctomycetota bacterium]
MATIYVTGADGFVGGWLRKAIEQRGDSWAAFVSPGRESLLPEGCDFVSLDLADEQTADLSLLPVPDGLIHLAAISSPPVCEANPELAQAVNVDGPRKLYQAIFDKWPDCPIVHVSSGHVYKPAAHDLHEAEELMPVNVYGRTKLDGEAMAREFQAAGHKITVVRPFNHTGAGQLPMFALPSFAMRLAKLEADGGGELAVGWLGGVRDFLHVADVVDTYLAVLEHAGEVDLVNVCSGKGQVIGALLDGLLAHFDDSVKIVTEESRMRGDADASRLVGDTSRLEKLLGAAPQIDVDFLLNELVSDARARVAAGESLSDA